MNCHMQMLKLTMHCTAALLCRERPLFFFTPACATKDPMPPLMIALVTLVTHACATCTAAGVCPDNAKASTSANMRFNSLMTMAIDSPDLLRQDGQICKESKMRSHHLHCVLYLWRTGCSLTAAQHDKLLASTKSSTVTYPNSLQDQVTCCATVFWCHQSFMIMSGTSKCSLSVHEDARW